MSGSSRRPLVCGVVRVFIWADWVIFGSVSGQLARRLSVLRSDFERGRRTFLILAPPAGPAIPRISPPGATFCPATAMTNPRSGPTASGRTARLFRLPHGTAGVKVGEEPPLPPEKSCIADGHTYSGVPSGVTAKYTMAQLREDGRRSPSSSQIQAGLDVLVSPTQRFRSTCAAGQPNGLGWRHPRADAQAMLP